MPVPGSGVVPITSVVGRRTDGACVPPWGEPAGGNVCAAVVATASTQSAAARYAMARNAIFLHAVFLWLRYTTACINACQEQTLPPRREMRWKSRTCRCSADL